MPSTASTSWTAIGRIAPAAIGPSSASARHSCLARFASGDLVGEVHVV